MSDLSGRTVLVTGAASGIGLATTQRLLRDGANVVGADIQQPIEDVDARAGHGSSSSSSTSATTPRPRRRRRGPWSCTAGSTAS